MAANNLMTIGDRESLGPNSCGLVWQWREANPIAPCRVYTFANRPRACNPAFAYLVTVTFGKAANADRSNKH